jgi:hypothetical protein
MDSRESFAGANTGREEKEAVVRRTKAVGARGVYRRLGCDTGTNTELPEGRGVL